jgi:hypothetical protein
MEKVYFTNASSVNREQFEKDQQLHEEMNAFKASGKVGREDVQKAGFNKAKSVAMGRAGKSDTHD